ncbi:MAG: hypothetical protein WDO24_21165 [Pseudomonadota bacterium]
MKIYAQHMLALKQIRALPDFAPGSSIHASATRSLEDKPVRSGATAPGAIGFAHSTVAARSRIVSTRRPMNDDREAT